MKITAPSSLRIALLSAAVLLTVSPAATRADTAALSFTSGIGTGNNSLHNVVAGWSFTVTAPLLVTQLGLYDGFVTGGSLGDGFGGAHTVTLWTGAGTALTNAVIPAGTTATLGADGFRYVTLGSAVALAPGDYVITVYFPQSNNNADVDVANAATVTTAAGVTYGTAGDLAGAIPMPAPFHGSRQIFDTIGTAFPTGDSANSPKSFFGPNFQFTAVPEASTLSLLLVGAGVALFTRKRR